jgi:hypothetical protein
MNHKPTMLVLTSIVAAIIVTGIAAMTIPQQALAGGHHHHSNGVKVDQNTSQINVCSGPSQDVIKRLVATDEVQSTVCLNQGTNNADIQR